MADQCRRRRIGSFGYCSRLAIGSLALLTLVLLAACQSAPPPPTPAGGVYTSSMYHFKVTYPNGWQVSTPLGTAASTASATIPLDIVITRVDAQTAGGPEVTSFTIVVYNAKNKVAASDVIGPLLNEVHEAKSPLKPVIISGKTGYQDTPVEGVIPGTKVSDTHTDYYLFTSDYVYQISIDAISSDNATSALQAMLKSFTLLS